MIKIVFFKHASAAEPSFVEAKPGQSLMRAAVDAEIDGIAADCGGALTCATCHVLVRTPWLGQLPAMQAEEDDMLGFTASARQDNSRLSCQIMLTSALDGLEVELPASQY